MTDGQRQRKSKWDTPSTQSTPFSLAQDVVGSVSSLEAASAAAAKINAMLISKGKLKLPATTAPSTPTVNKMQKQNNVLQKEEKSKNEPLVAEVEINEVPIHCRNMLTKGATQDEISKITGAAVSTRGRYMSYADRATNNMGERPLYLCVQGPTKECVDRAVDHIKRLIADGMQPKTKVRTHSRFSTPGPTTNLNRVPSPVPSGPPVPPVGGPLRGGPPLGGPLRGSPPLGGPLRGPSVGAGIGQTPGLSVPTTPIVPPPAIQMAIQSAQTSGHYLQDKVFVGLEHADPSFNIRDKVQGPGSAFLQHIRTETGATVYLRGRGSGFMEPTSGREAFENLYIYITHPKPEGLAAAKKLCENLVDTIQSEYMTHQSQIFQSQRSGPAMAAAHMIATMPRPAPSIQPQPVSLGLMPQVPPAAVTSLAPAPATSQNLSQTLAAQQQAQAFLAAQKPAVTTVMVSIPQGVAYPQLHMQTQFAVVSQAGLTLHSRPPQPVPAPVPVPPPQAPQAPLPVSSQPQLYSAQVTQQAQPGLAELHARVARAPVGPGQVQVQTQPGAQGQAQVQAQQHSAGLSVGQHEQVLSREIQHRQPVKRRFREDLTPEAPEHHQTPMNTLGAARPGLEPMGMTGGLASGIGSGQSALLGIQRPPSPDRTLMPPPPLPSSSLRDAGRKLLPGGLDVHGRLPSQDEPRLKRGRLVSYEAGGDSDDDEEAANRARIQFQISSTGTTYTPPPRGGSPRSMGLPQPGVSTLSTSSYYKQDRRDPGVGSSMGSSVGSSPFWMARNQEL